MEKECKKFNTEKTLEIQGVEYYVIFSGSILCDLTADYIDDKYDADSLDIEELVVTYNANGMEDKEPPEEVVSKAESIVKDLVLQGEIV